MLLLTGCTTTRPVVSACPRIKIPPAPHYAIQDLKPDSDLPTASKAWVASLQQCDTSRDAVVRLLESTQ